MNPKVDTYLHHAGKWKKELRRLRTILLDCQLTEELKWGAPCYTFQKANIAILGELKEYCVLSFFKGALLSDTGGILVRPGDHTQAARMIPFTSVSSIEQNEPVIKAYLYEAIEVEKAGLKVHFAEKDQLVLPDELQEKFSADPVLKAAFEALTPGRRRAYSLFFSAPKQPETRRARIEKYVPQILDGKGLNDHYKKSGPSK